MPYPTQHTVRTRLLNASLDQLDAQRDQFLAAIADNPSPHSVGETYIHAMAERRRSILTGDRVPLPKPYARWLASATAGLNENIRLVLQLACVQEAHGSHFLITNDSYRAHILHFFAPPGLYVVDAKHGSLCAHPTAINGRELRFPDVWTTVPEPTDLVRTCIDGEDQIKGVPVVWLCTRQAINAANFRQARNLPHSPKRIMATSTRVAPSRSSTPAPSPS